MRNVQKSWNEGLHLHVAGHECDTDLCTGCARGALLNECGGSLPCNNMKLRFRQHKRVAMGKSDVQGWGSFLLVCTFLIKHHKLILSLFFEERHVIDGL
jgi:hypothetical protein